MAETVYDPQEVIFTKGDPSEYAYVIRSGRVEILDNYPDDPIRLALLGNGEIFGEMGLIDERPRSLTARSAAETRVKKVSRDEFVDLILNRPEESFRYLRMFFERLRAMNTRVAHGDEFPKPAASQAPELSVRMLPKTPSAASTLPAGELEITRFPFRVGRSSTRHEDPLEVNDLTLPDVSPFNVSRNHFSVEKSPDGIYIHDRGSYLGTIVNQTVIGGNHKGALTRLKKGENEVIAGSPHSPFIFRIDVFEK